MRRRFACAVALVLTAAFGRVAGRQQPTGAHGPAFVDITWMSISNVMFPTPSRKRWASDGGRATSTRATRTVIKELEA